MEKDPVPGKSGCGPGQAFDRSAVNKYLTGGLWMETGNHMQKGGLATSGRPHHAEKLARPNLQVDVIKRQKPFAAVRPVAQAYFAQADLGDLGRDVPQRVADRSGPKLASRTGDACRTPVARDHNWRGCVLYIGAHWIPFRFVSAKTLFSNVRS